MLYVDDTTGNFSMEDVERYLPAVSSQRTALVESYIFCIDKELSLKSYQLLQKGLSQEYGISEPPRFEYNESGKPSLARYAGIHFNMSHCKRAVACLLANHRIHIQHPELMLYNLLYHFRFSRNINGGLYTETGMLCQESDLRTFMLAVAAADPQQDITPI